MDVKELNDNICSFVKDKIKYIQNYLVSNKYINDDFFSDVFIFYGKDYSENAGFRDVWGKEGIYIFYINEDIYLDKKAVFDFNEHANGAKFKNYNAQNLKKGDCLYIGSSTSNSLYTRINQHFKESDCYGSLHLTEKNREILKNKVKIVAFSVKDKNLKYNPAILKIIEQELHEIYKPKAGSK